MSSPGDKVAADLSSRSLTTLVFQGFQDTERESLGGVKSKA